MSLKNILSGVSLACLLVVPVLAAEPLQPRAEVSVKGGTDRSLLTTEFWAPLAQQSDRVLYGDIRLMGDNDENREGNLGIGYRQVVDDYVVGTHGWIDRRRTQNNSTFHQLTFGVERLGHIVDARANVYIPLNGNRSIVTPNIGQSSPYLAGSGIFYDTNGSIVETPQYGIDGEVGYRIPVFQKQVDAIRILGGGYHFFREDTDNVTGIRLRTEAQINAAFSVGARLQHDAPRGSQGFLEATLKFPFSAKKLYQTDYLRSRLDESPERDVDIVTDSKVDTGLRKEIISTTSGQRQRVINVDNSNTNAGDGTKENPFNTLKAAEAILQDNDIIYVNHGTGTTQGMDLGINITKANVSLIGSGSDFVYDGGKFTTSNFNAPATGTIIARATAAPLITNILPSIDAYTGNAVDVRADNAFISGVTVTSANRGGILVSSLNAGKNWNSFTISNVTALDNTSHGIYILADSNTIDNVSITNMNSLDNGGRGIQVQAANSMARINNLHISDNTLTNNTAGIYVIASANGIINEVNITNNISDYNVSANGHGIWLSALSSLSKINKATILGNTTNYNSQSGVYIFSNTAGSINNLSIEDHVSRNNSASGITLYALSASSTIQNTVLKNAITTHNTLYGVYLYGLAGSVINNTQISDITSTDNIISGLYIASNAGLVSNTQVINSSFDYNTQQGIHIVSNNNANSIIDTVTLSNLSVRNNSQYGFLISTGSSSTSNLYRLSMDNSALTGNSQHGLYISKISATSTLETDLGGGAFNSAGQNNISGNTGNDIRLNYTGGGALIARNNYWGGGALTRMTLSPSTTIDSTGFLTVNPHP